MGSQISQEIKGCFDFLRYIYGIFGFDFQVGLSTMPENHLGDIETWQYAESALITELNLAFGDKWEINRGDGAFYGPKIDINLKDRLKRDYQCATIQLDFQLPQRFELKYHNQKRN